MSADIAPAAPSGASPEVFHELGQLTRQLHDALDKLGVSSRLAASAESLSDARGRLRYIERKTGEAADKVLTAVELAKQDGAAITAAASRLAAIGDEAGLDETKALAGLLHAHAARLDEKLTEIMLAQDFHDLTGQVVARVVALAIDLEDSLVKLLVRAAPAEPGQRGTDAALAGPVIEPAGRSDSVKDQGEVDELLASLGF